MESRPHRLTATVSGQAPSLASRCACNTCRMGSALCVCVCVCIHVWCSAVSCAVGVAWCGCAWRVRIRSAHLQDGLCRLGATVQGCQGGHAVGVHGVDVAARGQHACCSQGERAGEHQAPGSIAPASPAQPRPSPSQEQVLPAPTPHLRHRAAGPRQPLAGCIRRSVPVPRCAAPRCSAPAGRGCVPPLPACRRARQLPGSCLKWRCCNTG